MAGPELCFVYEDDAAYPASGVLSWKAVLDSLSAIAVTASVTFLAIWGQGK